MAWHEKTRAEEDEEMRWESVMDRVNEYFDEVEGVNVLNTDDAPEVVLNVIRHLEKKGMNREQAEDEGYKAIRDWTGRGDSELKELVDRVYREKPDREWEDEDMARFMINMAREEAFFWIGQKKDITLQR